MSFQISKSMATSAIAPSKYKYVPRVLLEITIAKSVTAQARGDAPISSILLSRARSAAAEHARLSSELEKSFDTKIAKRVGELSATTNALKEWESANDVLPLYTLRFPPCLYIPFPLPQSNAPLPQSLHELRSLLNDSTTDPELQALASEDLTTTTDTLPNLAHTLKTSLLPKHPFASLPALLEIRPGAGGSEAALFASELLTMYTSFLSRKGLAVSTLHLDTADINNSETSLLEAVLEIPTSGAYDLLRTEAGVHRVQRVPATESKGRTHTSAVSVLILPSFPATSNESSDIDYEDPNSDYYIAPADVRTDIMRARGAGGQHVNTTDSAVRLTHIPTGTVVAIQDSRSQHKNREKAWQLLRARIAQARREAREEEQVKLRRSIVGIAKMGRSDKVRTYNFSQGRCTDHRSGISVFELGDVLEGGEGLEKVMRSVKGWLEERELEALGDGDD